MEKRKLTEDDLWALIESAKWKKDGNYKRVQKQYAELPKRIFNQLERFYRSKQDILQRKFHKDWIGNPGIGVSDDGWDDLSAEVVARGKEFYNSITVEKLQKMADKNDYTENFGYCFHKLDNE